MTRVLAALAYALAGVVVWLVWMRREPRIVRDGAAAVLVGCVTMWPIILFVFAAHDAVLGIERFAKWYAAVEEEDASA